MTWLETYLFAPVKARLIWLAVVAGLLCTMNSGSKSATRSGAVPEATADEPGREPVSEIPANWRMLI